MVVAGFEPGIYGLRNSHLTTELASETNHNHMRYKICIYIQYGVVDHTTFDLCNPTIPILIKKPYQMHNKSGECLEITILWI